MRQASLKILISILVLISIQVFGQHMFYHLLAGGTTVSFSAASQSVNESDGLAKVWSSNYGAWAKQVKLTLDNSAQSGALTDFPVLVLLNSSRITYADFNAAGSDIRFEDDSGTVLPYEIEKWNTAGTSAVWVKVPSIAASTTTNIWMYYKNTAAVDAQNAAAVWSNSFKAVYHLNTCSTDSTGNHAGTCNSTTLTTGQIGGGVSLTGALGSNITVPTHADFNFGAGDYSFSIWVKRSNPQIKEALIDKRDGTLGYMFIVSDAGSSQIKLTRGATFAEGANSNANVLGSGVWQLLSARQVAGTAYFYINGVAQGSGAVGSASAGTATDLKIGEKGYAGSSVVNFTGVIDEVQISSTGYSDSWMKASYLSQSDGFITFSAARTKSLGTVTVTAQLNSTTGVDVTVPFTVSGTASNPADHNAASGNITITAGQTSGANEFYFYRDTLTEGDETVIYTMGTPTNATAGATSVHTVTIVDEVNANPVANTDAATVTSLSATSIAVLTNDTDANLDPLSITGVTQGTYGTVSISGSNVVYAASGTFAGTDSFTYSVSDGRGGTATGTVNITMNIPFTWIGSGGNANWNTAANWAGGVVPGASDTAYFNAVCVSNCSPTINVAASVKGIVLGNGYAGTVTQGAGNTLTVGTSGWIQVAGTFTGGNSAITNSGSFLLSGGTFTSTSGTLTIYTTYSISGASTFIHNSGTVLFSSIGYTSTQSITSGTTTYNNVSFAGNYTTFNLNSSVFTVNGTLTMDDVAVGSGTILNSGTILAKGNVNFTNYGVLGGTALIKIAGSGNQTVTGAATARIGLFEVASTGGTVTYSGTLNFRGNYTVTSGTVDTTTSTVMFTGNYSSSVTIVPGTVAYYNVSFSGSYSAFNLSAGTMTVNGTLTFNDTDSGSGRINNGTLLASGNVIFANYGGGAGTALLKIVGSGNQTITGVAAAYIPAFEVASTGGTVTYSGSLTFSSGYTITSGTVEASTSTVKFYLGYNITKTYAVGTVAYNNVTFSGNNSFFNLNSGTMTVNGTLIIDSVSSVSFINSGTILAYGNINLTNLGIIGTGLVKVFGSSNQTITGISTAACPNIEIASTGGTVTYSGTIAFSGNYLITSGTVDTATSTALFNPPSYTTVSVTPGAELYNNVTFKGYSSTFTLTGTMTVNGALILGGGAIYSTINTGTISAKGNVTFTTQGADGTALLKISGSSSQTITGIAGSLAPNFEVASTGGTVTYSGTVTPTRNYTVTSGTVDASTATVAFTVVSFITVTITPGAEVYNNMTFAGYGATYNLAAAISMTGNMTTTTSGSPIVFNMNSNNLTVTGTLTNNTVLHRGPGACGTITSGTYVGNAAICP